MTRRVVLDTNSIVSGSGWGGVPGLVLDAAFDGRFVAVTSVALLREVQDVIRRSKFAEQFPDPEALIDRLTRTSRVTDLPPTATILGDEDDNRLIDAARAGDADIIVTGDQLVLDADPIGSIRVLTAAEFLPLLEQLERR